MFEQEPAVEVDDAVSCAEALVATIAEERAVVARRFAQVAAWADFHCAEPPTPEARPHNLGRVYGEERRRRSAAREQTQIGADGTPPVTRAGVVELGMLLQTSTGSATALLRDVLELRHRLPGHWDAVQQGHLEGWKGRQVAVLTRRLTRDQARAVDTQVLDAVIGLPWGRAKNVVEGKVIAADQAAHAARLAEEENRRFVSTRRGSNTAGLRTLIARGHAGDIARLEAMIAHIAILLEAAGDSSPADFRRAKALAMLANPALTCVFLADVHQRSTPADSDTETADEQNELELELSGRVEPLATDEPEEKTTPSAVELAVAFGDVLHQLDAKALDRLRPRSVLYLHLAAEAVRGHPGAGVARVDDPVAGGPIGVDQLRAWLRNDRVTVRPVLDPNGIEPVDDYEIPVEMREAARLLNPYETFPYGTLSTRQADLDHPVPYVPPDRGGPPGQTALTNLGPLGRTHHLAKTFDGFAVHQLTTGLYVWRTPTGHWYQVDHAGTRYLGHHPGQERPAIVETAERLPAQVLSTIEARLRDAILRYSAA